MVRKTTLIYLLLGIGWIVVSDLLLGDWWGADPEKQKEILINIGKGILYVSVTSSLLFIYLSAQLRKREQKEEQFLHLFKDHPNPMLVCGKNGLLEAVNPAAAKLYGYSETELLTINYHELSNGSVLSETANGTIQQHKNKQGAHIAVRGYFKTTHFYGASSSWLIVLIDTTEEERIRSQNASLNKEVKLQESYLYSFIEAQSTFLIRIDVQGKFLFRNKAFLSLFGQSIGMQLPQYLPELLQTSEHKKLNTLLAKCTESPGKNYTILLQMSLAQTLNRTTEWEFLAIQDENGVITEIQGIGRDVTDKLQYLEQLSAYKEQLESILRTLNDVVWSIDADSMKIRYLNAASKQLYGRGPEEFYDNGSLWLQIVLTEDRERVLQHTEKVKLSGSGEIQYRIKRPDGSIRHIRDRSVLVNDEKGKPRTINGIATDITALVSSLEDVKKVNDQVKTLLETMTDAFFSLDENLRFNEVNTSFEKLLGKNRSELKGSSFESCFSESGLLIYVPLFDACLRSNQLQEKNVFDQHLHKWFSLSVYPVPGGLAVFISDQTDNHLLQEALVNEQRNLEGLINNTSDYIWSVDRNLRLITGNDAFKAHFKSLFGIEALPGEAILPENQPIPDTNDWQQRYNRALKGESFISVQSREFGHKTYYNEISFYPIRNANGAVSSIGCFGKDITDRKEKEMKIKEQNEQLREIAWIESHKLRAPLANMMAIIELLNLQPSDIEYRELREKLSYSCYELDSLIREVVNKSNALSYFAKK